jgi:hypothetical protein
MIKNVRYGGNVAKLNFKELLNETLEERNIYLEEIKQLLSPGQIEHLTAERHPLRPKLLKLLYKNTCQICGEKTELSPGKFYSQVHHLYQIKDGGPDEFANMVVVCPNCHILLDYGSIQIDLIQECVYHFDKSHWLHGKSIKIEHYIEDYYVCIQNDRFCEWAS